MRQIPRSWNIFFGLLIILISLNLFSMSERDLLNLGVHLPFGLHEQLNEQMAQAIEQGVPFENIQAYLLECIQVAELMPIFLSWKAAKQNPCHYSKTLKTIQKCCQNQHDQEKCKNLIQTIGRITAADGMNVTLKDNKLLPEELEAAHLFNDHIKKSVCTILKKQGAAPEIIDQHLKKLLNVEAIEKNIDLLEKRRDLFLEIFKAQKMARQIPHGHRSFLAAFFDRCLKARPKEKENIKTTTTLLALIYCADQEKKFIEKVSSIIPLPSPHTFLWEFRHIIEHFPTENLKGDPK